MSFKFNFKKLHCEGKGDWDIIMLKTLKTIVIDVRYFVK